jgi:hypothetical protein
LRNKKLPRIFAIGGIAVGVLLMLTWYYVDTFDTFHLPTVEQAQTMQGSFSAPWTYHALQTLTWLLCPAAMMQALAIHVPAMFTFAIWILAALINAPIYYGVGLVVEAILRMTRAG